MLDQLNFLNTFGTNWDGYGAIVPNKMIFDKAINFVNLLPETIKKLNNKVFLSTYGTIVFDIENNCSIFSIEIGEKNIEYFIDSNYFNKKVNSIEELLNDLKIFIKNK